LHPIDPSSPLAAALPAALANARIMMVDDEPTNLKLAEAMLRTAGYRNLLMVQDPRVVLGHFHDPQNPRPEVQAIDLILLDLNMPHLDGFAVMAQLLALRDPLLPPILVLTAQGSRDHMLRALHEGARDFVAKPFDRAELLMRVRNLVDTHLTHRALHHERNSLEQRVQERTATLAQEVATRQQAQAAQLALLQEKEGLLREIHHRVKNNLQVISSLLRLEAARGSPLLSGPALQDMQGRIRAMALLHESLYTKGAYATLDLAVYLKQLAQQTFRAMALGGGAVRLELQLASVALGIDQASPCGLLVNELISNALKHGFAPGQSGEVRVSLLQQPGTGLIELTVQDNGLGLAADFETRSTESLGLVLAHDLARQMGGQLSIGPPPRAVFSVRFAVADSSELARVRQLEP
jgi:two-component sensor histidine kinase